jgi:transposase InsO family protein
VANFLDDFVCFSPDLDTHLDVHLPALLAALREHHLHCNPAKVFVCAEKVAFLGFEISPGRIAPLQDKLDTIASWPPPASATELRSFLGLCNFYRPHVRNHAFLQAPLDELTGRGASWRWEPHHQSAFVDLRTAVSSAPCVAMARLQSLDTDPFVLACDASDVGIGGVLSQYHQDTDTTHPVAFFSKKFSAAELNYSVNDKESLAAVACLARWRHYLASGPFELRSDNVGVVALLRGSGAPSRRQARWLDVLSEFHFSAVHVPGKLHVVPDVMSRRPFVAADVGGGNVEDDIRVPAAPEVACAAVSGARLESMGVPASLLAGDNVAVASEIFQGGCVCSFVDVARVSASVPLGCAAIDLDMNALLPAVASATATDRWLQPVVQQARLQGPVHAQHHFRALYTVTDDGCVYTKIGSTFSDARLCVPQSSLRVFLRMFHTMPAGGHRGRTALAAALRQVIYCRRLDKRCAQFVASCDACQRNKSLNQRAANVVLPIEAPIGRWTCWSLDFITGLPRTKAGFDSVLSVTDRFSKTRRFIPTTMDVSASGVVDLLLRAVVPYHGFPVSLLSDRDSKFTSAVWKDLFKRAGVKLRMSTANHSTTNGSAESSNRVLEVYLRAYVSHRQTDWDRWLPFAELALNTAPHSTTSVPPCVADVGRMLRLPTEWSAPPPAVPVADLLEEQRAVFAMVREQLTLAQHETARRSGLPSDRRLPAFAVGDSVLVNAEFLMTPAERDRPKKKLAAQFVGPYSIVELVGTAYRLDLPPGATAHTVFAAESLKPYIPPIRADEPDGTVAPFVGRDAEVIVGHAHRYNRLDLLIGWESMARQDFVYRALKPNDGYFFVVAPGPHRLRQFVLDFAAENPELIPEIRTRSGCPVPDPPG